jgi:hypothetical protein
VLKQKKRSSKLSVFFKNLFLIPEGLFHNLQSSALKIKIPKNKIKVNLIFVFQDLIHS